MTLSASTIQLLSPDDIQSNRLCITRSYMLSDSVTSYDQGVIDGLALGSARGYALGFYTADAFNETAVGMAVGMAQGAQLGATGDSDPGAISSGIAIGMSLDQEYLSSGSDDDSDFVSIMSTSFGGGGPAPTSPTLTSSTTPGELDPDPDAARWKPVEMVFDVPAGYSVVIQAQIGVNSALWMSVYDEKIAGTEGQGALAPLFADKSSASFTGTVMAGRTFTASILPNGGWQRPDVKIVPYVTLEVT